jgi:Flp pilus assembly pilin Flp
VCTVPIILINGGGTERGAAPEIEEICKETKTMESNKTMMIETETMIEARTSEKGVTTVEYAVMLVLVALAVAAFGAGLSGSVTGVFTRVITALG